MELLNFQTLFRIPYVKLGLGLKVSTLTDRLHRRSFLATSDHLACNIA